MEEGKRCATRVQWSVLVSSTATLRTSERPMYFVLPSFRSASSARTVCSIGLHRGSHKVDRCVVSDRNSLRLSDQDARLLVDSVQEVRIRVETAEVLDRLVERFDGPLGRACRRRDWTGGDGRSSQTGEVDLARWGRTKRPTHRPRRSSFSRRPSDCQTCQSERPAGC